MSRLVVFGDSLAAGGHAYTYPGGRPWADLVADALGLDLDNQGVGGSLLHDPASGQATVGAKVGAWLAAGGCADVAVILAGHNDIQQHQVDYSTPMSPTSLEQSKWAAVDLDNALRPHVLHVLWVTLCPRTHGSLYQGPTAGWETVINARRVDFNAWLVANFGPRAIDTRGLLGDQPVAGEAGLGNTALYIGDGLHLNPSGHEQLAPTIIAALRALGIGVAA